MSTLYLCPKCNRRDHWFGESCLRPGQAGKEQSATPSNEGHASGLAPVAIRKAEEFLKKVGRPRVNRSPEEKRRLRREYMKKRRALK